MPTQPPSAPPTPSTRTRRMATLALMAAALLGLAGCSTRPPATSVPLRPQPVLQSAGHWQVVATDVASAISTHLERQTGNKVPVHVYMMRQDDTVFADALTGAVTTRLVGLGHLVSVDERPDVTAVGIDVLLVRTDPAKREARYAPGPLTYLAAGVTLLTQAIDPFPWGITAGGLLADAVLAKPGETDTELVLTLSIARDGFYTFRTTAVYYVNGRDLDLYQEDVFGLPFRDLNRVDQGRVRYDLARRPYIIR